MCFHALLRWSDIAVLQVKHIRVSRWSLHVTIPKSKTDQIGQGCGLVISALPGSTFCPVKLTRRYLAFFKTQEGWLQPRSKSYSSPVTSGPAEKFKLSYATSLADLRRLIRLTGRDAKDFSEHSGRRGGASLAHRQGLSWLDIKRMGRWKSDSASQKYVDVAPGSINPVSASLARCVSGSSVSEDYRLSHPPDGSRLLKFQPEVIKARSSGLGNKSNSLMFISMTYLFFQS